MVRKLSGEIKCPACEQSTPIVFKKPGYYERLVVHRECENCESELMIKISRNHNALPDGPGKIPLSWSIGVTKPSQLALDVQAERAKDRELEAAK